MSSPASATAPPSVTPASFCRAITWPSQSTSRPARVDVGSSSSTTSGSATDAAVRTTSSNARSRSSQTEGEAQRARERLALERELIEAELAQARLLLELLRPAEAEALLTRTLDRQAAIGNKADLLDLRAEAREALGDTSSAADDRRAAKARSASEK